MSLRARFVLSITLVVLLFLALTVGPGILEVPIDLVIGWWPAMIRLSSGVHPAATVMSMLLIAIITLIAGTDLFLRWIYAEANNSKGGDTGRWRLKWTLCGFGILICTLAAIGSAILTTHQLFWLSRSSEPLVADRFRERIRVLKLAADLQTHAQQCLWEPEKVREAFVRGPAPADGESPLEILQPVWVSKNSPSLEAIVLIPRRPVFRDVARIVVLRPGAKPAFHKLEEITEVLASFGIRETK